MKNKDLSYWLQEKEKYQKILQNLIDERNNPIYGCPNINKQIIDRQIRNCHCKLNQIKFKIMSFPIKQYQSLSIILSKDFAIASSFQIIEKSFYRKDIETSIKFIITEIYNRNNFYNKNYYQKLGFSDKLLNQINF